MYQHFAKRLKERYNLDITPLEYIDLIAAPYTTLSSEVGRKVVELRFKGRIIKAVKQKNCNKFLITALNPNL